MRPGLRLFGLAIVIGIATVALGQGRRQKPVKNPPKTTAKKEQPKFTDNRKVFAGIDGDVGFCTILPKSGQIFAAGTDFNYRWWDASAKSLNLKPHDAIPATASLAPDAKSIALANTDGDLQIVRTMDARTMATISVSDGAPIATFWSPDSNRIGLVTKTGHVKIYDVDTKEQLIDIPNAGAETAEFTKAGDMIITHNARSLRIYESKTGEDRGSVDHDLAEKADLPGQILRSPDGKSMIVTFVAPDDDEDKDVTPPYVLDVETRKSKFKFPEITKAVWTCAWSPDGSQIAFGGSKVATIYDVATQKRVFKYETVNKVLSLAWAADGKSLLVGESGGGLFQLIVSK